MAAFVAFFDLLSFGLVGAAGLQSLQLARSAPRPYLRRTWLAMAALLMATLALGTFSALGRFTAEYANLAILIDATVDLTASTFMFGVVTLARRTADDVLKIAELEDAAFTDPLTGLPNRRAFDHALGEHIARSRRHRQELALIAIDVDHFKRVNDENGHEGGDEVLTHVGRLLSAHRRQSDLAFRIGGEEFAVLVPQAGLEQGRSAAERLRRAVVASPAVLGTQTIPITLSLGVARLHPSDDAASLLSRADEMLYGAKRTGRNRVCAEFAPAPFPRTGLPRPDMPPSLS